MQNSKQDAQRGARTSRFVHSLLAAAFAFAVTGCTTFDVVTSRATDFNSQVADVQDQTLLMNVMRSAYRQPVHFTELTTLTGTSTITGSATLGLPFSGFNGGMSTLTAAPGVTASQSPTFNVAVLETQNFYQGILKPLTPEQLYLYISEGLQPSLVYSLTIGEVLYQEYPCGGISTVQNNFHPIYRVNVRAEKSCDGTPWHAPEPEMPASVHRGDGKIVAPVIPSRDSENSRVSCLNPVRHGDQQQQAPEPGNAINAQLRCLKLLSGEEYSDPELEQTQYAYFRRVLNALLARGLSIENASSDERIGPPMGADALKNPKVLKDLYAQQLEIGKVIAADCDVYGETCPKGWAGLAKDESEMLQANRQGVIYRVQKHKSEFNFCFDTDQLDGTPSEHPEALPLDLRIAAADIPAKSQCALRREVRLNAKPSPKGRAKGGDSPAGDSDEDATPPAERSAIARIQSNIRLPGLSFYDHHQGAKQRLQPKDRFSIFFQPRSTQEVIYALGETARWELGLDSHGKHHLPPTIWIDKDPDRMNILFAISDGNIPNRPGEPKKMSSADTSTDEPAPLFINFAFNHQSYKVLMDPSAQDRSGQVLSVVSQLLALNRDAKDFPAPSIIPLLTP